MTIRVSRDSGRTWSRKRTVREGEETRPAPLSRPMEYPPCACPRCRKERARDAT
ncbi:hypothetical protein GCM10009863_33020 [Streptomyces axinellae]|uniref:Uncharacterized protein n=1 Tax=Streptomyces axinellae TaxID=552788 RepID=A0ABN3Q566_9ACTN